jgi:periplasmic protein TonB
MSTTAVEVRGPNKALFRTAALAGSAVIWGSLGYLALTYVPKYDRPIVQDGPTIDTYKAPKIIDPPPPPIIETDITKTPDIRVADSPSTPPTITVRTPNTSRPNPLAGELPAGPPPSAPATGSGEPIVSPAIPWVEPLPLVPPTIAEPIVEPIPPPLAPRLIINPVRQAGANPIFPPRAIDRGVSGEVTLSFTVSPTGKVENIDVTGERPSGYGFARAAREAIQGWTFQPQTIDGIPVAYPARYTISFKLED